VKKLITAGLLGIGLLVPACGTASASADPSVCDLIAESVEYYQYQIAGPVGGYMNAIIELENTGLTDEEASDIVSASVHRYCPVYLPLEDEYYWNSAPSNRPDGQ
jgi:hypothetical protein